MIVKHHNVAYCFEFYLNSEQLPQKIGLLEEAIECLRASALVPRWIEVRIEILCPSSGFPQWSRGDLDE